MSLNCSFGRKGIAVAFMFSINRRLLISAAGAELKHASPLLVAWPTLINV